jgi:hypothetical protein
MDLDSEDEIREEIRQIKAISYAARSADDKKRLNDLEAEIRRRHPELQQGKIPNTLVSRVELSCGFVWCSCGGGWCSAR